MNDVAPPILTNNRRRPGTVKPLPRGLGVEALGPGGAKVPCHLRRYQRAVYFAGGEVGRGVPLVVVLHAGRRQKRRRALRLVEQLRRWGYRSVNLVRRKAT